MFKNRNSDCKSSFLHFLLHFIFIKQTYVLYLKSGKKTATFKHRSWNIRGYTINHMLSEPVG